MSLITIHRPLHAELLYHVLAHLDLGPDAASLFRPDLLARPWVRGLLSAYKNSAGRLAVHGLPLCTGDLDAMMRALKPGGTTQLDDEAGQLLAGRLAAALGAERARVTLRMEQTARQAETLAAEVLASLRGPLTRLRAGLWAETEVPRLRILDCDALLRGGGTHGRGMVHGGEQVVAVSLAAPRELLLCQLLHEELHAVTDPQVLVGGTDGARETHVHGEGFALHLRLERRAVEAGQELFQAHAPELLGVYLLWCRDIGITPAPVGGRKEMNP